MINSGKFVLFSLLLVNLFACTNPLEISIFQTKGSHTAVANTNQVNISGLTISNETNTHLNKLEVYIPETNQRLSCGDVAQLRSCDIKFTANHYQSIYISWVHHQKYRESQILVIPSTLLNKQKENVFTIKINNLNQLEVDI